MVEVDVADTQLKIAPIGEGLSLKARAYDALKTAIMNMNIYADEAELRLDERDLSQRFGVSRTPLREALAQLDQEGLVRIVARRGIFIVRKTKAEILDMITVWAALESMAARLATQQASADEIAELHALVDKFSQDEIARKMGEYSEANIKFHQAIIGLGQVPADRRDHQRAVLPHARHPPAHDLRAGPGQALDRRPQGDRGGAGGARHRPRRAPGARAHAAPARARRALRRARLTETSERDGRRAAAGRTSAAGRAMRWPSRPRSMADGREEFLGGSEMSATAQSIDANAAGAEQELTDGFHLVIDALKLNGIKTIYGVPGIPITDFGRMAQAAGIRVISFRHEQNAGNAASIAGFLTKKPGICLTVSAPGFLNGLTALANATTNCFPMILISGSSEREIVDLQQGDYEEMDQLAIAKPLCKAAFRVLHAADIGIGVARAIRAAVSGRPGGVYLDLPAKLFAPGDGRGGRREVARQGHRRGAGADSRARRRQARARRAEERQAPADHPRQGRRLRAGRRRDPRAGREERHSVPADEHGQGPAARHASAVRGRGALDGAEGRRRRDADRRAPQLAAVARQGQDLG